MNVASFITVIEPNQDYLLTRQRNRDGQGTVPQYVCVHGCTCGVCVCVCGKGLGDLSRLLLIPSSKIGNINTRSIMPLCTTARTFTWKK